MDGTQENELLTLLGGESIKVTNRRGEEEVVKVRELRFSEYEKLLPIVDDEEKCAALYCDKDQAWAAMLDAKSLEAVIIKGEELNFDPFDRWLTRRAARTQRVRGALGATKFTPAS